MARNQRGRKRARQTRDDVPQVYLDMLSEEAQRQDSSQRRPHASPHKKQKLTDESNQGFGHPRDASRGQLQSEDVSSQTSGVHSPTSTADVSIHEPQPQTVFDDSDSSSDSDIDWEKLLNKETENDDEGESKDDKPSQKQISVDLGTPNRKTGSSKQPNRLPSTAVELRNRLNVHKMHLCCLLAHVYIRNAWSYEPIIQVSPLIAYPYPKMLIWIGKDGAKDG